MDRSWSAAVVGGGPAGLAAAWTLAASGAAVTVYERRPRVGGLLRTDELDGARVDAAVQLLGSYYAETFRLAAEAGAAGSLVESPGRDALWRAGRARPVSYGSVSSMAVSGALPARLKFRLASRYAPYLLRREVPDAAEPAAGEPGRADDESIAAWGRRELGEDFVELLAYPLLAAYYGSPPEETSAAFYHALARAGMDVSVYAVRGGVESLAGAVARGLEERGGELRTAVAVKRVRVVDRGVEVAWDDGAARHDAAVLALPAPEAAAVAELPAALRGWLGGVRYAPTGSLALRLDRPAPADYFGLSFPRTESPGDRLAAVCVQERKGAALVPEGEGALVVFPAPSLAPRLAGADPREALDLLLPAVERAFPGIGSRVVRARAYRFPTGAVRFYPGYLGHLRRFDPRWLPPALALAGDYLVSPTVEGAVRSGRHAAALLLERRGNGPASRRGGG